MPLENQIIVPKYVSGIYNETILTPQQISAVDLTGNQTISGEKTFDIRPSVNGSGVLLSGDLPSLDGIVYTSGNQLISGAKRFVITAGKSFWVDNQNADSSQGWIYVDQNDASIGYNQNGFVIDNNSTQISGPVNIYGQTSFVNNRPTVNGTGVLLQDQSVVYTTGNQTIEGDKTFNDGILFKKGDMPIGYLTGSYNEFLEANYLTLGVYPANGSEGYVSLHYMGQGLTIGEGGVGLLNNNAGPTYISSSTNNPLYLQHPSIYINSTQTLFNCRPTVNYSGVL